MLRLIVTNVFLGLVATMLFIAPVSAQFDPFNEACQGEAVSSEVCQAKNNKENPIAGENGVLVTVLNILSFLIGVTSVLMVILGGFKYIMSNGDSNMVSNAKNTVLYALVGLVVFLFSQVIIRFVIGTL